MKITHIGAENCVTGSCHLIQTDPEAGGVNILLDCGIVQGHDPVLSFDQWPVTPSAMYYLFLTHAHIDHTGRVPDLIDAGFSGEIICTHATRVLLTPMLRDAMSFSHRTDAHIRSLDARIDSPLGIEITRLYQDMDDCWDKEARTLKAAGDIPIRFKHLYAVERFQDHRRLLDLKGPAIIIAGSGMCTGGRIVSHLKHGLDDPKNDLFFVGYQAAGTPGRAILEGRISSKAAINCLTGYSAHADQQTLSEWVSAMPEPPGEIRLVHGEPRAQTTLARKLNIS